MHLSDCSVYCRCNDPPIHLVSLWFSVFYSSLCDGISFVVFKFCNTEVSNKFVLTLKEKI